MAPLLWQLSSLGVPPRVYPAPEFQEPGVEAVFYESLPWQGRPTRSFAWIGLPEGDAEQKKPAMVLVHGGGGTAFADWVRLWTGRGYAAIAMDTCGCTAGGSHSNRPRHEHGGPPGWGGFQQMEWPIEDQWVFHAVADVILAHSLLRSRPEVDPNRVGITGISWGGFLTCIVAAVDSRFAFAAPVYGCGFASENENWRTRLQAMGERNAARWSELWDPASYLPRVTMPMLWINGTNDQAFPMNAHQRSYRLPPAERSLCIPVRMEHAHGGPGENPVEILAFANSFFRGEPPLARITNETLSGRCSSVTCDVPLARAELNFTTGTGAWKERHWRTTPALLSGDKMTATAELPCGASAFYFNLIDERGLMVSSEYRTLEPMAITSEKPLEEK